MLAPVVFLCLFAAFPALADDSPLPRVGQVGAAEGSLAIRSAGGEWADSAANDPVAAGMSVRTSSQGRARLLVGADAIALAAGSEVEVARLDSGGTQLVLRRGRIAVRLSALDPARGCEIDLPQGGVWLTAPGDYDITAGDERTPGRLAAFDGEARFVGKGIDAAVPGGSALALQGGGDPVIARLNDTAADDFTRWWQAARRAAGDALALLHLSAETTGWQELDGNGSWEMAEGYGAVWFPDAGAAKAAAGGGDWAPYRYGRWRWIAPWGWSWIDNANWAFAPSHYGRWAHLPLSGREPSDDVLLPAGPTERWGWVPGNNEVMPGYMPAVVAFLGTPRVGLSYPDAFGPAIAWFPLGPGEIYWPAYTADPDMIRRINAPAVPDADAIAAGPGGEPPADVVNAEYRNRRLASVVPRAVFVAGRPVAPALIDLPGRRLDNAPLLAGSPQLAPASPQRPAAVAVATAGPATTGAARLAAAAQALSQILAPRGGVAAARSGALVRAAVAPRPATVVVTARAPASSAVPGANARIARSRILSAAAARGARPRLHLAAIHRR